MTDIPARCETPEHLRSKSGWHWIHGIYTDGPVFWSTSEGGEWRHLAINGAITPEQMAGDAACTYLCPVDTPDEVAALHADINRWMNQHDAAQSMLEARTKQLDKAEEDNRKLAQELDRLRILLTREQLAKALCDAGGSPCLCSQWNYENDGVCQDRSWAPHSPLQAADAILALLEERKSP
jgi:hypothetical protein